MILFTSTQPAVEGQGVTDAIRSASSTTGVAFSFLLKTAQRESSLEPDARAATSSATGLFQFIDQTWLQSMKVDGPALGLGAHADKIERNAAGRYVVRDDATRREILDLRKDPQVSALLAGAFTRRNHAHLSGTLGREPTPGELYIAHFMGAGGAAEFIRLAAEQPDATAAEVFPAQARANRPIFYDRKGAPLPAAAVYDKLVRGFGEGREITAEIAPAELGAPRVPPPGQFFAATAAVAGDEAKLPQEPARWLAIPVHNAYAIEARKVPMGLQRTETGAPVADAVAAHWQGLGPLKLVDAPPALPPAEGRTVARQAETGQPPLDLAAAASGPPAMDMQFTPVSLQPPRRNAFASFLATLFSVQPNAPHAGG